MTGINELESISKIVERPKERQTREWKYLIQGYSDIPIKMFQKNILFFNRPFTFKIGQKYRNVTIKRPGCCPFNQVLFSIFNL